MRVNNESQIGGVTLDLKCTHSHTHKALEGVVVSDVSIRFLLTVNVQSQVWLNSNVPAGFCGTRRHLLLTV